MSYPEVKPLIRDLDIMDDPSESSLSKALADRTNQVSIRHPTSNYKICTVVVWREIPIFVRLFDLCMYLLDKTNQSAIYIRIFIIDYLNNFFSFHVLLFYLCTILQVN